MIGSILKTFARDAFVEALSSYADDAKAGVVNTVRDTFESIITGRRTIDEWAEIASKGVDQVKRRVEEENGWRYVGGRLNFAMSPKDFNKVTISYELYYQDENDGWQRVTADSDMQASNFTIEALESIEENGKISFEVE